MSERWHKKHEAVTDALLNPDVSYRTAIDRLERSRVVDDPNQQMMFGMEPRLTDSPDSNDNTLFYMPRRGQLYRECIVCRAAYPVTLRSAKWKQWTGVCTCGGQNYQTKRA